MMCCGILVKECWLPCTDLTLMKCITLRDDFYDTTSSIVYFYPALDGTITSNSLIGTDDVVQLLLITVVLIDVVLTIHKKYF